MMASTSMSPSLPEFLFNGWQFRPNDIVDAKKRDDLQGWNVSSLCSAYLKYQLDGYERELQAHDQVSPPSLISLSVGHILEQLRLSIDLPADVKTVAASLDLGLLHRILQDPRTPYPTLRLFDTSNSTTIKRSGGNRKIIDIDEAVLASEQIVRSSKVKPSGYLVTLKDLSRLFGPLDTDGLIAFKRKSPPKGGFEFLDQKRKRLVQIQGTDAAFIRTFDRVTRGLFKGLDWNHVFIQGGMVLHTLLHTAPSKDDEGDIAECDIDLYLYGLTPEEANIKVEEIYKVYAANIGHSKLVVVKNANIINFIPQYPDRRLQIVLKLLHSPLESLLRVDLDACAVGFDGSQVFMLPRCARAIETGYLVFTMDLLWGHRLGNRRETSQHRVFKYANRGFGLRILPSYCQSLEKSKSADTALPGKDNLSAIGLEARAGPTRIIEGEPGLKTLRRIAYLAENFVRRCYFGPARIISYVGDDSVPDILLYALDGYHMHAGIPDGPDGLGTFELLMRHCEAWRLDAMGLAHFEYGQTQGLSYDVLELYDGLPTYKWDANTTRSMEDFKTNAMSHNGYLFSALRKAIEEKLNIHPGQGQYVGYLTRRIRRLIADSDIESVQAKQITMPLVIPLALQTYITDELGHQYDDIQGNALSSLIIPAHDTSKYDPSTATLPSLYDTSNESGNLRYWLITNKSMWAGQHRVLDEVAELLFLLVNWFAKNRGVWTNDAALRYGTDTPECIWHISEFLRRRLILPETSNTVERGQILPEREARLFRAWALTRPPRVVIHSAEEEDEYDDSRMQKLQDELAKEGDIADERFWKDGDEGIWDDEEGVPVWQD